MKLILICLLLCLLPTAEAWSQPDVFPRYKPSSRSPEPLDIRTNEYGASRNAPDALGVGARVPDFKVPRAGGGWVALEDARRDGSVAIIFYRGHW